MRELLRLKAFRYQFLARTVSVIGSTLSPVALSLGVLSLTGSPAALSIVLAASTIPTVLFLLVGGVWADRLPRHKVLVATNLVSAVTQGCLALMLLTGMFNVWVAAALQFITGTAIAFYFPATTGLTADTVPSHLLQKANALMSLTRSVSGTAGPLLAGVLTVTIGAGWALGIDAVTFAISAVLLAQLVLPRRGDSDDAPNFFSELRVGFREVITRSWVWSSIVAFMFFHVASAIFMVLGPMILLERDNGELSWAAVIAALSIGEVIGDVVALRVTIKRPIVIARLTELLTIMSLVALAFDAPLWALVSAAVFGGIALTLPDSLWYTAIQQHLPAQSLSRVSSYEWLGSLALRPVGYVSAAGLAAAIGPTATLMIAAGLIAITRIVGLCLPGVRKLVAVTTPTEEASAK